MSNKKEVNFAELGIGVDIEDINRFKKLKYSQNKKFYEKIFTEKEIEYCLSKKNPHQHFAARFCAKEAFMKALNRKVRDYKSIEIKSREGRPFINWRNKKYLLSLSHDKDMAIAFVIAEL